MRITVLCSALLAGLFSLTARAQGVTIGAAGPPDASAALEVRTTSQGLLLPRLTSVQRQAIASPAAGLLVFQTDGTSGLYYYNGISWLNLAVASGPALAGAVTTLAGSGTAAFADGTGPAASFYNPAGVACDGSGNVYVADQFNNRIRKIVAATGVVTTLAGSGSAAFADGTGTGAAFSRPFGVACDGNGNVYVADYSNQRIRKIVASTGAVTTLAGNGTPGLVDGTGTAAQFGYPIGVACDASGNVFVADYNNSCIRKIVAATAVVSTVAGTGTAGFADGTGTAAQFRFPTGVACDANGNVFVADYNNNRIRRIVAATAVVSTVAGSGTAAFADGTGPAAAFNLPRGVACDAYGNVYVADQGNHRIRKIVLATAVVSTVAGSGTATFADGTGSAASFNAPYGVACDGNGNVYVADQGNNRIRVVK